MFKAQDFEGKWLLCRVWHFSSHKKMPVYLICTNLIQFYIEEKPSDYSQCRLPVKAFPGGAVEEEGFVLFQCHGKKMSFFIMMLMIQIILLSKTQQSKRNPGKLTQKRFSQASMGFVHQDPFCGVFVSGQWPGYCRPLSPWNVIEVPGFVKLVQKMEKTFFSYSTYCLTLVD